MLQDLALEMPESLELEGRPPCRPTDYSQIK